jgi:opacity protein-like surface antigen
MRIGYIFFIVAGLSATPALADQLRDYCPDRPGLATPSCIIDRGHASLEVGLADWTLDKTSDMRSDQIVTGNFIARFGVTDSTEAQLGWTSYGRLRTRDRMTGAVQVQHRTGDVMLGISQNILHPDGSGFSLSILPSGTLPVGRSPIGAGDWSAGLRIPVSIALNETFSVGLTPEIDAAVDADGDGRHLAYGSVAGLAMKVSKSVTATLEYMAMRDQDPDRTVRSTQSLASLSVGWQPSDDLQFDVGTVAGLNHQTADIEAYVGISRRF